MLDINDLDYAYFEEIIKLFPPPPPKIYTCIKCAESLPRSSFPGKGTICTACKIARTQESKARAKAREREASKRKWAELKARRPPKPPPPTHSLCTTCGETKSLPDMDTTFRCKVCNRARIAEKARIRRKTDPEFRAKQVAAVTRYFEKHRSTKKQPTREELVAYYATNPDKICTVCKEAKPLNVFERDSKSIGGRGGRCRSCTNQIEREKSMLRKLARPPKPVRSAAEKRTRAREYKREYRKKMRATPEWLLDRAISESIRRTLKRGDRGAPKTGWRKELGYSFLDLKLHLEALFQPGMTWDNYGVWHIDHIKPRVLCKYTTIYDPEFQECWGLHNLQPLWGADNIAKGANYDPDPWMLGI